MNRIFFIEGGITVIYGIVCLFFMPHTPSQAKFLTLEEKKIVMAGLRLDSHGATDKEDVNEEKFDWHWVKMAFTSPNLWMTSLAWYVVADPMCGSCSRQSPLAPAASNDQHSQAKPSYKLPD